MISSYWNELNIFYLNISLSIIKKKINLTL